MNNRAQVLVSFVLVLPIIILIVCFLINRIYLYGEKHNQEDIIKILCDYSMKEQNIDKIIELGKQNDPKQDIKVIKNNNKTEITLIKKSNILNMKNDIVTKSICE